MSYLIYTAVIALCLWSAFYLLRRLIRALRGRGGGGCCGGGCGGCPNAPDCGKKKE